MFFWNCRKEAGMWDSRLVVVCAGQRREQWNLLPSISIDCHSRWTATRYYRLLLSWIAYWNCRLSVLALYLLVRVELELEGV